MNFGEKLKMLREEKGWTQTELAEKLGLSLKTISNYETKGTRPRNMEVYRKIAELFDVDINYLITVEDNFVMDAREKFGYAGARDAKKLLNSLSGLFAGGELPEEDKDKLFNAIAEAYYEAKIENKKYGRKGKNVK